MSQAASPPASTSGATPHDAALIAALSKRLIQSVLPGDPVLVPEAATEAAGHMLTAAQLRPEGQRTILIEPAGDGLGTAPARDALPGSDRLIRILIINDDMPFLVDSVSATLGAQGLVIERLLHPVLPVMRDGAGHIVNVPDGDSAGALRESWILMETRRPDARGVGALQAALDQTLTDVRAAVDDWHAMQAAMEADARALLGMDRAEDAGLLRWFKDGMLTQLGHVRIARDGALDQPLGIFRAASNATSALGDGLAAGAFAWADEFVSGGGLGRLPLVMKSPVISRVHRHVPLDVFVIPIVEAGKVVALSAHMGVWTSAALVSPPTQVPRLRVALSRLMETHGFSPSGHAGKSLIHALSSLPHDQLIGFAPADVERIALTVMGLIDRPRPRLAIVPGALDAQLFAFVWLPRDQMTTTLRHSIAAMLTKAAGGRLIDWSLAVDGASLAQLRFVLAREGHAGAPLPDEAMLDARLRAMLLGWIDAVEEALGEGGHGLDPANAPAIATRYADAFPLSYRHAYGAGEAAIDIGHLMHLKALACDASLPRGVRLYRLAGDKPTRLRLKIYQRRDTLILSDVVPVLENFGFRVADSFPTDLAAADEPLGHIHDFLLGLGTAGTSEDIDEMLRHAPIVEDALTAVLNGVGEDDPFNRLITALGLSAREANWLRALYRYLRQTGLAFSIQTAVDALANAPVVGLGLVDLLRARHRPGTENRPENRKAAEKTALKTIAEGLSGVSAINDDRLLRAYRDAVLAILRTNAFAPAAQEALAFKFDSAAVPGLPKPLPWREIFVYSARVEGIHLRAGPVARGGLRWSDRRDDFRTEVLGLMKAQRVKNAVIVPTGAKGGFYPKRLPDPAQNRDAWAAEGRAAYQIFIRTLLSITDNIKDGKVVHPTDVIIRDGDDPYFVVAADKGTATFSDTANALAAEADFWLDDAFASGGSKGYDHKAMGITARGGWISVQRHFAELGVDVQTDPVRVVGVGDMSGDVFGNGMLLSKAIKLVAAFDHRHIFLDPEPNPAKAWEERARLFALPRSSWDDYDKALISKGGGVFPRSLKSIPLSPQIRAALGIEADAIEPDALIRAILTAQADLLWFGGIGTYVKAAHEAHNEVGDPANDAVRINGADLRVRVIGEGANLGITQAGRIEAGLLGLRGNTDFIDNSAGVDCSDKEVNIKIALASAQRAGRLSEDQRVALLIAMTDDVAELVLEDNRLQALGLSIAEQRGVGAVPACLRLIDLLSQAGQLDRATDGLADDDTFMRRAAGGKGLTRPELAVLLSSAKLTVQEALEASSVVDDPALVDDLLASFPAQMRDTFGEDIRSHRLRREILATRIANRLINRLGFVHPFELAEEEGVGLAEVAAAFLTAERLFDLPPLWATLEAAEMAEATRINLFAEAAHVMRGHIADLLRAGAATTAPLTLAAELAPALGLLDSSVDELVPLTPEQATLTGAAARITKLERLDGAVGLAALARDSGLSPDGLARDFVALGKHLGLDWAQGAAVILAPSDAWERPLVAGLARDFQQMRLDFLRRTIAAHGPSGMEMWLAANEPGRARLAGLIARARTAPAPTPAMLALIGAQARALLAR